MQQTLQVFIIRKWLRQPRLAKGVGELRTHKDRLLYAKDRKSGCNFLVETGVEVSVFATLYSTPLYYSYHSATSKQSTNQGTRSCSWILHSHLRPPTFRALFRQPPFSVDFCNCLYLPTTIRSQFITGTQINAGFGRAGGWLTHPISPPLTAASPQYALFA